MPTTRKRKLAIRQPREPLEGYDPRQLLVVCTEVYGLVSGGPSWWRRSLLKIATEDLGYEVIPNDKCVVTLPPSDPSKKLSEGFLVIEVDDVAEAGSSRHLALMAKMEGTLNFGKVDNLQSSTGSNYAGRHLRQRPDGPGAFESDGRVHLRPIAADLAGPSSVEEGRGQGEAFGDREDQLRGLFASLNWLAREGGPDVAAAASFLAADSGTCPVGKRHGSTCQDQPNQVGHTQHPRGGPPERAGG